MLRVSKTNMTYMLLVFRYSTLRYTAWYSIVQGIYLKLETLFISMRVLTLALVLWNITMATKKHLLHNSTTLFIPWSSFMFQKYKTKWKSHWQRKLIYSSILPLLQGPKKKCQLIMLLSVYKFYTKILSKSIDKFDMEYIFRGCYRFLRST